MVVALAVGLAVAIFVYPLLPDEPPSFVLDFAPGVAKVQFKAIGGIAIAMTIWIMYPCVFRLFQQQDKAVAKANVEGS